MLRADYIRSRIALPKQQKEQYKEESPNKSNYNTVFTTTQQSESTTTLKRAILSNRLSIIEQLNLKQIYINASASNARSVERMMASNAISSYFHKCLKLFLILTNNLIFKIIIKL
jgi:hypothetical protein